MINSKIKLHFNSTADYYFNNYVKSDFLGEELLTRYLKHLLPLVKDKKVLEIGCGPGTFIREVSMFSKLIVGVDFSEEMLRIAKYTSNEEYLLEADALYLPFKNNFFDIVYCIRTFQHVPDYHVLLKEINRVLSYEGIVVFDFMNVFNPFGFIRSSLSHFSQFVYLRADKRSLINKLCNDAHIKVLYSYPLQLFVDYSNINKYLPETFAKLIIKAIKHIDSDLKEKSFMSNFALRHLLIGKKINY